MTTANWVAEFRDFRFVAPDSNEAMKQLFMALRAAKIQPGEVTKIWVYPEGMPRETPQPAFVGHIVDA